MHGLSSTGCIRHLKRDMTLGVLDVSLQTCICAKYVFQQSSFVLAVGVEVEDGDDQLQGEEDGVVAPPGKVLELGAGDAVGRLDCQAVAIAVTAVTTTAVSTIHRSSMQRPLGSV